MRRSGKSSKRADAETRDLDENTLLELDAQGQICTITLEHATERTRIPAF